MKFTIKNNKVIGTATIRGEKFLSIGTLEEVWQELSAKLNSVEKR